jgi:hypothetical protein
VNKELKMRRHGITGRTNTGTGKEIKKEQGRGDHGIKLQL